VKLPVLRWPAFRHLFPWLLLALAGLVYGVLIPWLGLYWDDFPYVYFGHVLGTTQYHRVFFDERPFLPVLYNLTAPIFNENPITWQIFALVGRWALALCFGWLVRLIWPKKDELSIIATVLFLVYPGFSQQWVSNIYSRIYILEILFLLSLGWMIQAARASQRSWLYSFMALIAGCVSLLGSEYFFGLEFIRPLLLWFVLRAEDRPRPAWQALLRWLPYLALTTGFGIWRGLMVQTSLYDVRAEFTGGIPQAMMHLAGTLLRNTFEGGLLAWGQSFTMPFLQDWKQKTSLMAAGIAFCGLVWSLWVGHKAVTHDKKGFHDHLWQPLLAGIAMLLLAGAPMWAAGLPVKLEFPYNRFLLAFMPGSALLLAATISWLRKRWAKVLIISLLITAASGWHFSIANSYRVEWFNLRAMLRQLTWRAPGIQPGTLLVAYELPFQYYSDNSLTAVVNWTYAPEYSGGDLPYLVAYQSVRKESTLKNLSANIPVTAPFRSLQFKGNTSNLLVLYQPEEGCLRLMDDVYASLASLPRADERLSAAVTLVNLERIQPDPKQPAVPIPQYFPGDGQDDWCYYFEKADLARQMGDSARVAALWDAAKKDGYSPRNPFELQPFIEGLGMDGRLDEAINLTRQLFPLHPSADAGLCQIWGRIKSAQPESISKLPGIESLLGDMRCAP